MEVKGIMMERTCDKEIRNYIQKFLQNTSQVKLLMTIQEQQMYHREVDISNATLNGFMVRYFGIFYCQQCQIFRFYYITAISFPACSSLDSLREGLNAFSNKNSFAELYNWILQHDKFASMDLIPTGLIQASSRMQHIKRFVTHSPFLE